MMARLAVFNHVTLDGFFTDPGGDMSFAHRTGPDPEWDAFVEGNAGGGGTLVFGRKTYDMMAGFWPTPMAAQMMPVVAERMNNLPKVVFSRTMKRAAWNNTTLVTGDLASAVRTLKRESARDMVILGSGSIVSQLSELRLIDAFQFVVNPVVLGKGRTMFETVTEKVSLRLTGSRAFGNGNVLLSYELAG
jgi:dihydrofolate reductase